MYKKILLTFCWTILFVATKAQSIKTASFSASVNKAYLATASNILNVQNINTNIDVIDATKPVTITLQPSLIVLDNATPFLTFALRATENIGNRNNTSIEVRFGKEINNLGAWKKLESYAHNTDSSHYNTSELLYIGNDVKYYQLRITSNKSLSNSLFTSIDVQVFSPGNTPTNIIAEGSNGGPTTGPLSCNCAIPTYVTRTQWGHPQGQTLPGASTTNVTHLIVHHSDGSNTSSDWAATVRAIRNFHVNTNGWADVGYNFLIAPDGTLYEGRRSNNQDVTGAHFCGFNAATMGVCMLGSFTSVNITNTAQNTLVRTLAWKCCDKGIDPTTTAFHSSSNLTLNRISGHRDGCATSCPGNTFYPNLPTVRTEVSSYINNGCNLTSIRTVDGLKEFNIYPNPSTTGNFEISLKLTAPKKFTYRIVNAAGKTIFTAPTKTIAGSYVEKLQQLQKYPAGIYYLELSFNNQTIGKTVIK
jgi:hypothetical protein